MLKKTQVYQYHLEHGHIVEYAGYDLPVWYEGIIAECRNVRDHSGIFDVSHMGRVIVEGPDAARFLDHVTTNNVSGLSVNQGHYSLLCNLNGGIIDDLTIFCLDQVRYLVVYNAANREKNWNWLQQNRTGYQVGLNDVSDSMAMFAVQGPRARDVLRLVSGVDLENVDRYSATKATCEGVSCLLTRTGYTGEDGFEAYVFDTTVDNPTKALRVWEGLIGKGRQYGLHPVGLGARDVLRLEAGMCLYGNDIDEKTSPVEARLMFVTRLEKQEFLGKEAIAKMKKTGPARVRVGFKIVGRGIPRHGQPIHAGKETIGIMTSGTLSPTLGESIGMGYVKPEYASPDEKLSVRIRETDVPAIVVKLPFYQRRSNNQIIVYGHSMTLAEFRKRARPNKSVVTATS